MLHGFLSRPNSSLVSSVGKSEVLGMGVLSCKPESVLNRFAQLLIVFLSGSYLIERVRPETMLISMPTSHFDAFYIVLVIIEEQTQKLIDILENLLITPLAEFNTCLSCNKDHQDIVFGAGVDESNRVSVVFLSLQDKVNPAFATSPEGFLERNKQFVLEAIPNAHDRLLIGFGEGRAELNEVSLQNAQGNGANDFLGLVDLAVLRTQSNNRATHVDTHNSCVEFKMSLTALVESLEEGRVATSQRNNIIFSVVIFFTICPGRHILQFDSLDVGLQIEFPIHYILNLRIFLAQITSNVVTHSFSQRYVLMSIVALLVSGLDSLLKKLISSVNVLAIIDYSFIFIVEELAINQSLHGLTVLFFHEFSNGVVFFGAVHESGSNVHLNTCKLIWIDPSSNTISALEDYVRASLLTEGFGGTNACHSSADDDHLMDLLHIFQKQDISNQSQLYLQTLFFSVCIGGDR